MNIREKIMLEREGLTEHGPEFMKSSSALRPRKPLLTMPCSNKS